MVKWKWPWGWFFFFRKVPEVSFMTRLRFRQPDVRESSEEVKTENTHKSRKLPHTQISSHRSKLRQGSKVKGSIFLEGRFTDSTFSHCFLYWEPKGDDPVDRVTLTECLTCSSELVPHWSASHPAWPTTERISHNPPGPRSSSADLKENTGLTLLTLSLVRLRSNLITWLFRPLVPVWIRVLMSDSVDRLLPQVKKPLVTWQRQQRQTTWVNTIPFKGGTNQPISSMKH